MKPPNEYSYGYGTMTGSGINLDLVLTVFRKRWPLMLAATLIIVAVVSYSTIRQPYFFRATAKVLFSAQDMQSSITRHNPLPPSNMMVPPTVLITQESIIRSDAIMERVATALGRADREKKPEQFSAEVRRIKGMVGVSREGESQIFRISAVAGTGEEAQKVANAAADAYVKFNYERTIATYRKSISWLGDELVELERKLEDAQNELINFIESEKMTNFGDAEGRGSGSFPSAVAEEDYLLLRRLNTERVELELKLSQLGKRYREAHPKVVETTHDLAAVDQKIAEEEKRLSGMKRIQDKEIIVAKKKEIRYAILSRKIDINKKLYDTLVRKLKETDIDSSVVHNNVDVLEYARAPGGPAGPNKQGRILFSLAFGLAFSIGLAMLLEFMDTSLRTVDEVQRALRVPVLAVIPRIAQNGNAETDGPLLLNAAADTPLREAYRMLRTNIRFSASSGHGRVLMVTSTVKGEGKSTITVNMGVANAEAGKKTLLVDADFRVHSLSKDFEMPNDKGLTQYLTEGGPLDDYVSPTKAENLWIFPSGPTPPKPAMLLESERMKDLIQEALAHFDQVIIDTPPVGFVIDPVLIANWVEGIVLVVEAGGVGRTNVAKAIEQMTKAEANLFGIVLNKEESRKKSYYYYGYKYGKGEGESKKVEEPVKPAEV